VLANFFERLRLIAGLLDAGGGERGSERGFALRGDILNVELFNGGGGVF
jgi:hypothetical protein